MGDLYFVCLMEGINDRIRKQDAEIAEAKWMPIVIFPFNLNFNRKK